MILDKNIFHFTRESEFKGVSISAGSPTDHPKLELFRDKFISQVCAGKKVIHMGCSDHLPVIDQKRKEGTWLHDSLLKTTALCYGIDIDPTTIDLLTNTYKVPNLFCCDATATVPDPIRSEGPWDIMLAGELIEHIDDPVMFLRGIHKTWKGLVNELIITTPNAFSYVNFRHATQHVEWNNPDHRYWYSPHTLGKICYEAGFTPHEFFFVNKNASKSRRFFDHVKFLNSRYPMLRTTIVMKCKF